MISKLFLMIFALWTLSACGVKGDPLPPDEPATLGRGKPTFKKAVRGVEPIPVKPTEKEKEGEANERSGR